VGVVVDDAWHQRQTMRIEVLARLGRCNGRIGVPDRGDTPVAYRYLTLEGLAAPSVVDTCMGDQQIKHEGKAQ
jgi:hypothetical protein